MKLHAMIVGTGFVPYFAIETVGISAPMLGLAAIDASFKYTALTSLLTGMLTIFCAVVSYMEYTGQMDGKMFAMYHYFLSSLVAFWQFQPTTTAFGAAFFALPHMFTAWTTYLVVTNQPLPKKA